MTVNQTRAKVIMVQGTASGVRKSVLVTALCRIFAREGLRVAPFKAQNMSLNSAVTPDGLEIGRAQAVQAEAAGTPAMVEMNPILLKPEADDRSQVVVMGKPLDIASARDYYARTTDLWPVVTEALDALRAQYDVVVIEGAGSPAEINLREHDIVNMRVALYAQAPVLLVADIDRGGVFASLVGTMTLLTPEERETVKAFVINKFRGEMALLQSGLEMLSKRTGVPVTGVIPYFNDIYVPEEDSLGLEALVLDSDGGASSRPLLDIAVIGLPHMANFDDFDPLRREPAVRLRYVKTISALGEPDLMILPGTKTTMSDLEWLRHQGLATAIIARHRAGTPVIGVCGGYQMLGETVLDPNKIESDRPEARGLGLLPVITSFASEKVTHQVRAEVVTGIGLLADTQDAPVYGYEIHMGRTTRTNGTAAPLRVTIRSSQAVLDEDGAINAEGTVLGTYLHGFFHNEAVRHGVLAYLVRRKGLSLGSTGLGGDATGEYDKLADLVRSHLDMEMIGRLVGVTTREPARG